jgi:PAS domain S-box-containing protein
VDLPRIKEEVKFYKQNLVESFSQSYRLRDKNGKYKWFYDYTKMERDESGNLTSARGYIFDQTNLFETKEKLILNEQKLANVIQGTRTGTWEWNIQTGDVVVNERWAEIIGYKLKELNSAKIDSLVNDINKDDLVKLNHLLNQHFTGEIKYFDAEFRQKHKNGSWVWINSRGCIVEWSEDGKPLIMTGTHIDISDRKSAEEKVVANERRLELIYESLIDLYYKTNIEGIILEISPSVYTLSGYTPDEIIGRHVSTIYSDFSDRQRLIELLLEKGKVSNFGTKLISKSGKPVEVSINSQILFDSHGKPESIAGTIRDVTEQNETSEKLKYALARNQALLDSNPDLMFVISSDNTIIDFKASNFNELYMMPEHFLGKKVVDCLPSNVAELCNSSVIKVLETGNNQYATYFLNMNDKIMHYEARFVKCGTKEVMAIIRNITEMVKNEELKLKLSKAVEQSPASIIITNTEGKIEFINPKFSETTGYTLNEVLGKTPGFLKSGYHPDDLYKNMWTKIKSGKEWTGELYNITKNGELIWEYVKISPIFNNENKITHYVGITENITERKKILEDLIVAKEKAEESDRLKTAFLQNMSHEIRTPLNGIIGFSKLLSSGDNTESDIKEYSDIIKICGNRLIETINNLLDISMIETGQIKINPTNFSINSMIMDLYENHLKSAVLQSNELQYFTGLDDGDSYIFNDSMKINQILTNLISNAIKFTTKGIINFGYKLIDDEIIFSVSDTGIGIAEDQQKHIFDRFWQGDTSISRNYEGSGLGLAISIELAKLLDGKLSLESVEGKGSTFYFSIKYNKLLN